VSEVALELSEVSAGYGTARVLWEVTLGVGVGEVGCLLGRNGAGKTTLLKTVMGLLRPETGRVRALGRDITGWPGHRVHRSGMVWVPQDNGVFPGLTVQEHLALATGDDDVDAVVTRVAEWFPVLAERRYQEGQTLSGGERKMLGIAQALVTDPQLLLLDEPTEGVAPQVVEQLLGVLAGASDGRSVLLVEQNIDTALTLGGTAYVLEEGRVVAAGPLSELHDSGELQRRLTL
jgi:branched-chain amino acid transport system ATP-binding protein